MTGATGGTGATAIIAYSPRGAADACSLSLRSIMTAIAAGKLPSVKKGRRRLVFAADLEAYLRSAEPPGRAARRAGRRVAGDERERTRA
jgi:excisionase family DNA binding protein